MWGGIHGLYQIVGDSLKPHRERIRKKLRIKTDCFSWRLLNTIITFGLVTFAWIFFRADTITDAFIFVKRIIVKPTPWLLFNGGIFNLGLDRPEMNILMISILILFLADLIRVKKGIQPLWNTYYYLREALKTQSPKLIVLEGYCTTLDQEYMDDSRIIKNNYGLHWSFNKMESLKISAPKDRWREFFLEYIQYHTRYKELTKEDFFSHKGEPLYDDWKGFWCNMITTPLDCADITGVTARSDLFEKTETYYRAVIELAKENKIPLIVIVSPYAGITEEDQQKFNRAGDIAAELGVPFLNCNLLVDEIGIDYAADACDVGHLNFRGNQKYSKYLGQYISERYDIPDHRGDERYASWERHADFIRQMIYDQELVETTELNALCKKIKNGRYWTFVSVDGVCNTSESNIRPYLNELGIFEEEASGIWFLAGGSMVWYTGTGENEFYRSTFPHDFHLSRVVDENGAYTNSILVDNTRYFKAQNGMNVVVYDAMTEKIVDTFGVGADYGYILVR